MVGLESYNTFGSRIVITDYFYKGTRKYYNFTCNSCEGNPEMVYESFTCRIDHFKSGNVGCGCNPYYRRSDKGEMLQLNTYLEQKGIHNKRFTKVIKVGYKKFYTYRCDVCSPDQELFPELKMLKGEVKRLQFPCKCSQRVCWSPSQYKVLTERVCIEKGYELVDFNSAKSCSDKVYLKNKDNGVLWRVSLRDLLSRGNLDPSKSKSGFKTSKPAHLYLVRWYDNNCSFLKFGITNRKVLYRIKDQLRLSYDLNYEILNVFHDNCGQRVLDCESEIKQSIDTGVCLKEILPDGYTETCHDTQQNIDIILQQVSKFNLKEKQL